jgi:hypothetical protein
MKYYHNDIRTSIAIVVILQLITITAIAFGVLFLSILVIKDIQSPSDLFFYILIAQIILVILLVLLLAFLDNFQAKLERRTIKFVCHEMLNRPILYGRLEDLETVHRLKIIEDDIGGIYIDRGHLILGSLKTERKCTIKDFKVEKKLSKCWLGNYLIVRMGSDAFAFTPCNAFYDQSKSQADRVFNRNAKRKSLNADCLFPHRQSQKRHNQQQQTGDKRTDRQPHPQFRNPIQRQRFLRHRPQTKTTTSP